jgi:uncharacterized membrane protein YbjE (DUF340 family)
MKNVVVIFSFFVSGILLGAFTSFPRLVFRSDLTLYALYLLLFLIGIGIGSNARAWHIIKRVNIKILLVPLSVIVGTFLGVGLFSVFVSQVSLRESLAIGAGFGYYSLSSILIAQIRGETLGVIALLSNIIREIMTILITPALVRYFGKLAPIASGGATSMDTTLPIITKFTGKEYAMISVFSGVVLTILAPLFIILFLRI